jgi:hypothetical protein
MNLPENDSKITEKDDSAGAQPRPTPLPQIVEKKVDETEEGSVRKVSADLLDGLSREIFEVRKDADPSAPDDTLVTRKFSLPEARAFETNGYMNELDSTCDLHQYTNIDGKPPHSHDYVNTPLHSHHHPSNGNKPPHSHDYVNTPLYSHHHPSNGNKPMIMSIHHHIRITIPVLATSHHIRMIMSIHHHIRITIPVLATSHHIRMIMSIHHHIRITIPVLARNHHIRLNHQELNQEHHRQRGLMSH